MSNPKPQGGRRGPPAPAVRALRGCLLFLGDHLARSVRGVPCAPPPLR